MAKKSVKKSAARPSSKRSSSRRELVDTGTDKRYAKRASDGTWKEMDDVGRSLAADTPRAARKAVSSGFGDQGDSRRVTKRAAKKR